MASARDTSALFADRCPSHGAVAAVLAEKRCGRELDQQSHTLTCARFASTQLMLVVVVCTVAGHLIAAVPMYIELLDVFGRMHCSSSAYQAGHSNAVFHK